uniref:Ixostatin n=1 Tax=Caenorhabditis tropicalis TaxID=1561998 RepID=A0A1I7T6X0_9PELO
MSSLIVFLFAFPLLVCTAPSSDGMYIDTREEFYAFLEQNTNTGPVTTRSIPTIPAKVLKQWNGQKVEKPNFKNKGCEEILFNAFLSSCPNGCTSKQDSEVTNKICNGMYFSEAELKRQCCPDSEN